LTILAVSTLAISVLQTQIAPAVPTIQRSFGASPTSATWVVTIYVLVGSAVTPILGRLGDIYGKNRLLVACLACAAIGCFVAALASSLLALIAARALQGAGCAIFALSFGIVRDELPARRRATAVGLVSSTYGVGAAMGIMLSGVVVDHLGWRFVFWIAAVVLVAAALAAQIWVPPSRVRSADPIDGVGALLFGGGLGAALLAVTLVTQAGWASAPNLALFAVGLVLLAAWIPWELRRSFPMVDLRLMGDPRVWPVNFASGVTGYSIYVSMLFVSRFVETPDRAGYGFGATVSGAGLLLLPWTIAMIIGATLAGAIADRIGARKPMIFGLLCAALGFVSIAVLHATAWQVVLANIICGAGIGFASTAGPSLIARAVPRDKTGEANAMTAVFRTSSGATSAQVGATILAATAASHGTGLPAASGYTIVFALAAALCILAGMLVLVSLRAPRPAVQGDVAFANT
jgi:MFS family permease